MRKDREGLCLLRFGLFNRFGDEFRSNGVNDPVDLDLENFGLRRGGGKQDDQKNNPLHLSAMLALTADN